METSQRPTRDRSIADYGLDLLLALMLFAAGLGMRWLYAEAVVFPSLDESAFYLTTAENAITGRGLEVDVLGNYQFPFPRVTHPSHEHWMPLTTGLIAAAFAIQKAISGALDTSLRIAQMPGLFLGAMLAPLTYLVGRRSLPGDGGTLLSSWQGSRWVSLGAALLVAINAALSLQAASADSSAPLALLGAWALAIAVRKPGDRGGYLGVGLLIALAYLTHTDGLLLLIAIPLAWLLLPAPILPLTELPDNPAAELVWKHWPREERSEGKWRRALGPGLISLLDLAVAFALVATPWLVRNYLAFGTMLPVSVLSQAWLSDPLDAFNYVSHPNWQTWLAQGWQALLAQRVQALLYNSRVFLASTFPWGLVALPGLWLLRREWSSFPALVYSLLLFFGVALAFPVSSMSGTFYRALGAAMPLLALAAMYTIQRVAQRLSRYRRLGEFTSTAVAITLVLLAGVSARGLISGTAEHHQSEKEQFEVAAGWLAQHAAADDAVMTTQPHSLNYASGHPCIVVPGNEPPEAAWKAAQRYGARFLIIAGTFGNYPHILEDQPDPRFRLLEETETLSIYEIGGNQP